jgi:hypothetical protein
VGIPAAVSEFALALKIVLANGVGVRLAYFLLRSTTSLIVGRHVTLVYILTLKVRGKQPWQYPPYR